MKAAELFIRCLEHEGVEYIFGIPGEENLEVMDALLDSSIRFITTRHEQGAAFILAGNGVVRSRAWGQLADFAGRLNIPVANTFMAKGVIPFKHPCALGSAGRGV